MPLPFRRGGRARGAPSPAAPRRRRRRRARRWPPREGRRARRPASSPPSPSASAIAPAPSSRERMLVANRRAVAAGTTRIAPTSREPTASTEATTASAIVAIRVRSAALTGSPSERELGGSKPPAIQELRKRMAASRAIASATSGEPELARPDSQQRAEQRLVHACPRLEDIAGEHDAGGERGDEEERGRGVGRDRATTIWTAEPGQGAPRRRHRRRAPRWRAGCRRARRRPGRGRSPPRRHACRRRAAGARSAPRAARRAERAGRSPARRAA